MRSVAHGKGSLSISGRNDERKQTLDMWILQRDSLYYM
jgi:hypothetical protein